MEKIDIRKIKENLRAEFKNLRKNMKPEEKSRKDCDILEKILKLPEYQAASTILTYVSTEIEVDTKALIEQALQDGKT
ncbi:MAG: 5-formyltetrahydrofolate cyclo-ligase, partial [Oscillospiraceae bacterium]